MEFPYDMQLVEEFPSKGARKWAAMRAKFDGMQVEEILHVSGFDDEREARRAATALHQQCRPSKVGGSRYAARTTVRKDGNGKYEMFVQKQRRE
jgi:hypothetical protein